jgi:hypothetical protein
MAIIIYVVGFLIISAIWWVLFVTLLGLPWGLWLATIILTAFFLGIGLSVNRRAAKQQLQKEKAISDNTSLLIKYDDARIEEKIKTSFSRAKKLYMFIVAAFLLCVCAYILVLTQDVTIADFSGYQFIIAVIIIGIIGIYSVWFSSYRHPRILIKGYKNNPQLTRRFTTGTVKLGTAVASTFMFRCPAILSIAIYAILFGVWGAKWPVTLPFIIVSGILLALNFPSKKKFKKMAEEIVQTFPPDNVS